MNKDEGRRFHANEKTCVKVQILKKKKSQNIWGMERIFKQSEHKTNLKSDEKADSGRK